MRAGTLPTGRVSAFCVPRIIKPCVDRLLAVVLSDGHRVGEIGAEAAFVPDAADEFDVAGPFVELDIAAADEGLQIKVVCSADAVIVHSLNLASKTVERNPNFHDMAWFTRYDRTFSI